MFLKVTINFDFVFLFYGCFYFLGHLHFLDHSHFFISYFCQGQRFRFWAKCGDISSKVNEGAPWDPMLHRVILKYIKDMITHLRYKNFEKTRFCCTLTYKNYCNSLIFLDVFFLFSKNQVLQFRHYDQFSIFRGKDRSRTCRTLHNK